MNTSDIQGQDSALTVLSQFGRRLPATLLFQGPEGVGKKKAALLLAQQLLCERPAATGDPCLQCKSCLKIVHRVHPNLKLIVPDGTSHKIETIRDLLRALVLKPFEDGCQVLILDEADKMTEAAANAFLKTLEEPPVDTLFILISSAPGRLPATILSRCQKVNFHPLPESLIKAKLMEAGCAAKEADLLAKGAEGSLGTAQKMTAFLQDERFSIAGFFDRFPKLTVNEITEWTEKLSSDLPTTESFLYLLRHHLRDRIVSGELPLTAWRYLNDAEKGIAGHSPRNLTLEVLLQRICL